MTDRVPGRPDRNPIRNANRLKLGVFCANTMPALTTVPDLFRPSWSDCLTVARLADDHGLEALIPIARWKGYVDHDPAHPSHEALDPFIYAAALAQGTTRIAVFATTHAPIVHPLVVARQAATIDLVSGGRFGMNVVGGWNRREFDMFGIELLDHEERYAYLAAWLEAVRSLWCAPGEIDIRNAYFDMAAAISRPQPVQGAAVPIMNAGFSTTGMRFAARHSDIGLVALLGDDVTQWETQVRRYKALARDEFGRDLQVFTTAQIVLRDSCAEADAYLRHYAGDAADTVAADNFVAGLARENGIPADSEQMRFMRRTVVQGTGTPIVGDAAKVAAMLARIADAGVDGVLMSYVDFVDGLHRFTRDVLPRLVDRGLRAPA